jgi:hypothetical protein
MSKNITRQKTVIFAMVIAIFVSSSAVAVSPSSPSHNNNISMEIAYAQTLSGQTLQMPNEQTINDVRGSRLVLLDGVDNAIQRLIESQPGTSIRNQPTEGFDTTHIAQLLKADQLGPAMEELTTLEAKVIKVFGEKAAYKEVVPQIENLIGALKSEEFSPPP